MKTKNKVVKSSENKEGHTKRVKIKENQREEEDEVDFFEPVDLNPISSDSDGGDSEGLAADELRLRKGKEYLKKILSDSANNKNNDDIDLELVESRLREEAVEAKGKLSFRKMAIRFKSTRSDELDIKYLRGHQISITALQISADEKTLYSASKDCSIIKWNLKEFKKVALYKGGRKKEELGGHLNHIWALALSSDGKYLASSGKEHEIYLWDTNKDILIKKFTGHRDSIPGLAFRVGKHDLYSCSLDRSVKIWNIDEMSYMETLYGHRAPIYSIDALTRERCITCSQDKTICIWKIAESVSVEYVGSPSSIDCVSLVDESIFVSGNQSGSVQLWSVMKRKPLFTVTKAHGIAKNKDEIDWITSISACKYSDLFATGSGTGEIILWQISDDNQKFAKIMSIQMEGIINCLQFSKYGNLLIVAVSQDPRMGRWVHNRNVKNKIAVIKIPEKESNNTD